MSDAPIQLTFDDGPWPDSTDRIIEILDTHNIRATFFVIGRNVERFPDLARLIVEHGHRIANHSYGHPYLGWFRSRESWGDQIRRADEAIHRVTGVTTSAFRPPMGVNTRAVRQAVADAGKTMAMWDRRAIDGIWTTTGAIVRRMCRARAGEILLMHDGCARGGLRNVHATVRALSQIIATLRGQSLRFEGTGLETRG